MVKKSVSTSFPVRAAPKIRSKYATIVLYSIIYALLSNEFCNSFVSRIVKMRCYVFHIYRKIEG